MLVCSSTFLMCVPCCGNRERGSWCRSQELCWGGGGSTTAPQALWTVYVLLFRPKHSVSICSVQVWEVAGEPGSPLHHVNHSGRWEDFPFGCHLGLSHAPVSIAQCIVQKSQVSHQTHSAMLYSHQSHNGISCGIF